MNACVMSLIARDRNLVPLSVLRVRGVGIPLFVSAGLLLETGRLGSLHAFVYSAPLRSVSEEESGNQNTMEPLVFAPSRCSCHLRAV